MGRPGTGGGGGSYGGHSSGRTSGGHRMGGSRPGMSSGGGSSFSGGNFHRHGHTSIHMGGGHSNNPIGLVVVLVIVVAGFWPVLDKVWHPFQNPCEIEIPWNMPLLIQIIVL